MAPDLAGTLETMRMRVATFGPHDWRDGVVVPLPPGPTVAVEPGRVGNLVAWRHEPGWPFHRGFSELTGPLPTGRVVDLTAAGDVAYHPVTRELRYVPAGAEWPAGCVRIEWYRFVLLRAEADLLARPACR
jgi:hypothetical protein